ncbi:MAG: hypothetical protein WD990_01875 [Acidimicrobiia bacterium]
MVFLLIFVLRNMSFGDARLHRSDGSVTSSLLVEFCQQDDPPALGDFISQRLGHASIRTTYDIYGHLFEGRDRQAADALEAARARSLANFPRTRTRSEGLSLGL